MQHTSALRSTGLIARSAVEAYFEPLTWLGRYVRQPTGTTDERELTSRHLQVLFLAVVLLCGTFFTLGYVMGRTEFGGVVSASPFAFYKYPARGQVVIQVADVEQESDALTIMRDLQKTGFPVVLLSPHGDNHYAVLVGPYTDAKSAQAAIGELKAKGYPTSTIKLKE